jgi:two-component system KDP operon response regulator KdpE
MDTESTASGSQRADKKDSAFSVLVVDDEEALLAFVGIRLRAAGYRVATAADGAQALEMIKRQAPDLVTIDLVMPRMDGATLLKEIRRFSSVPVIILSAMALNDAVVRDLLEGADDYIHKPFNPDDLVARIEAMRRGRQGRLYPV